MAGFGLQTDKSFLSTAQGLMGQAAGSYSQQGKNQKTETEAAAKTVGGGLMAGAGMGAAGASIGASVMASTSTGATAGGWYGAAAGAIIGLASYFLS